MLVKKLFRLNKATGLTLLCAAAFGLTGLAGVQADDKKRLAVDKVEGGLSVMVLGSGGPVATTAARAGASYLIFVEGKPKILMDAGGGAYQRLAASGTDVKDLDIVLLSHLHIDHTGDLSAIVKTMYFHNRIHNIANGVPQAERRTAPFRVFGPATNGVPFGAAAGLTWEPLAPADPTTPQYPSSSEYVDDHFDLNNGVERYMHVFAQAISGGVFNYTTQDVSPNWMAPYAPVTVVDEDGLVIKAVAVNHGPVPALAYRIEYGGKSIVYSGDTSSKGNNMTSLSMGADMLIYDTALASDTPPAPSFNIFYALHTTPTRIGEVAAAAGVGKLVLSHITPQTEGKFRMLKPKIRAAGFTSKLEMTNDLKVYNLLDDHQGHHGHDD